MALTSDIGQRIELVPMDPHGGNISIALYRQVHPEGSQFLVHTYNRSDSARRRLEFVARAMCVLGGLEGSSEDLLRLWFSCHHDHRMAVRRIFLEACKLDSLDKVESRSLAIFDKKSNRTITVTGIGRGTYRLSADGDEEGKASRIGAV